MGAVALVACRWRIGVVAAAAVCAELECGRSRRAINHPSCNTEIVWPDDETISSRRAGIAVSGVCIDWTGIGRRAWYFPSRLVVTRTIRTRSTEAGLNLPIGSSCHTRTRSAASAGTARSGGRHSTCCAGSWCATRSPRVARYVSFGSIDASAEARCDRCARTVHVARSVRQTCLDCSGDAEAENPSDGGRAGQRLGAEVAAGDAIVRSVLLIGCQRNIATSQRYGLPYR